MRITVMLLGVLVWLVGVPNCLCAQETQITDVARRLPTSVTSLPKDTAFFYGIHNGGDFVKMLLGSDLSSQLAAMGANELTAEDALDGLDGGEINLGFIKVDIKETAEQSKNVIEGNEEDFGAVASQLLTNDAILVGDHSWTTSWESICKSVLIAKEKLSLEEGDGDALKVNGLDSLLSDEAFAKIRVPNTLVSFQLTDTAPASRLLKQISQFGGKATEDDLHGWEYGDHAIGEDAFAVFSYPLDDWIDGASDDKELTAEDLQQQKQLKKVLLDRDFQFAVGLVKSRLVFFVGEDLNSISNLVGANPAQRLVAQDEFASVLPATDEVLIASAYVSDRYVKSADALGDEGLLSNLMSFAGSLGSMAKVDDVPLNQAAMAFGIPPTALSQLGSKLNSIGERWDALAVPKAGWAATISASPSGITGRSVTVMVDPRLPPTPLSVDQHVGDDVIAFYARQGTTTAERLMLGYEFLSQAYIGFAKIMMTFAGEDEDTENVELHFQRLNQMPMRLAAIINDRWLPALGDGGQAIVATRFDPTPDQNDNVPVEFTLVSGVVNSQELTAAGDLMRRWANSWTNQYCQIIKKMDADDETEIPVIEPPMAADDGDSTVFTMAALTDGERSLVVDAGNEPPTEIAAWDINSIGTMFHWRLSDEVLAMGTNILVTQRMLEPKPPVPSGRGLDAVDATVRAVIWIDADQIAKMYEGVDDEDTQLIAKLIRCFDSYHRVTTTEKNKTTRRWKLSMKLGAH